jgi:hypothetical protein
VTTLKHGYAKMTSKPYPNDIHTHRTDREPCWVNIVQCNTTSPQYATEVIMQKHGNDHKYAWSGPCYCYLPTWGCSIIALWENSTLPSSNPWTLILVICELLYLWCSQFGLSKDSYSQISPHEICLQQLFKMHIIQWVIFYIWEKTLDVQIQ